jgi:hypothetical protein
MSKPDKNDITCTSTARINIEGMPEVPYMGYYNRDILDNSDITKSGNITNPFSYSNDSLVNNLKQSCLLGTGEEWAKTQGIYSASESNVSQYLPNGKDEVSLNIPFYLAKAGVLTKGGTNTSLKDRVNEKCSEGNTGVTHLTNQIQYLTCQLEQERNRNYSSDDFNILTDYYIKILQNNDDFNFCIDPCPELDMYINEEIINNMYNYLSYEYTGYKLLFTMIKDKYKIDPEENILSSLLDYYFEFLFN